MTDFEAAPVSVRRVREQRRLRGRQGLHRRHVQTWQRLPPAGKHVRRRSLLRPRRRQLQAGLRARQPVHPAEDLQRADASVHVSARNEHHE